MFTVNWNEIFGVGDKVAQEINKLRWHPGQENLADYQSKHHVGLHHVAVRPWYLNTENSPWYLPQAERPSTLKGCAGALKDGYIRNVPLSRVPWLQITSICVTRMNLLHIGYLPIPRISLLSDFLTKSPSGLSGCVKQCNIPLLPVMFI